MLHFHFQFMLHLHLQLQLRLFLQMIMINDCPDVFSTELFRYRWLQSCRYSTYCIPNCTLRTERSTSKNRWIKYKTEICFTMKIVILSSAGHWKCAICSLKTNEICLPEFYDFELWKTQMFLIIWKHFYIIMFLFLLFLINPLCVNNSQNDWNSQRK